MSQYQEKGYPLLCGRLIPLAVLAIMAAAVSGCANLPKCSGTSPAKDAQAKTLYDDVRKKIDTRNEFHNAVPAYRSYETPFSFYLLGIEKPRETSSDRPYCRRGEDECNAPEFEVSRFKGAPTDEESEIEATRDDIEKRLFEDPRSLVLTHVLNTRRTASPGSSASQQECFVFNVYGNEASVPWCKHRHIAKLDTPKWKREGWNGLDRLGDEIKRTAEHEKPTHIILLATGWNTEQYESFLDFRYWMSRLDEDFKGKEFRPIFIGITWESEWPLWRKIPIIGTLVSWTTKGNDADEISYTWANYLINDVLRPIAQQSGAQLVAIGHSFGSRIVLGSHYTRHVLVRKNSRSSEAAFTAIGMQAAFPIGRFISTEGKEHQYVGANKGRAYVVITTSKHDEATGAITLGTGYVGGPGGLDELRKHPETYKESITVLSTLANGQPASAPDSNLVSLYDASPFVNCELQGTGGGAHSDVYDEGMGHFLGEIIRASAKIN